MTALLRTAAAAVAIAAAGCGAGATDVAGRVTFNGNPVPYGTVVIIGSDGTPRAAAIQPDGTYLAPQVAVGPAKVAVSSPPPPGADAGRPRRGRDRRDADDDKPPPAVATVSPDVVKRWAAIPERYGEPSTSGLTAEVAPGQPYDIDLK